MSLQSQHEPSMAALRAAAREQGLRPAPLEPILEKFLVLADRYARLEKMVLGAVPLQFPAYLLLKETEPEDPLEKGARLAARERERMDLGPGAVPQLEALIEQQGLKVIGMPLPEDGGIMGAFLFDEFLGPVILADSGRGPRERDYALAHEYGHFLADNDPYHTFVCRRNLADTIGEAELRAHAFAGAFLAPGKDVESYLRASGTRKGDDITPELLMQLRTYFEADDRAVIGQLLASGWLRRGDVAGLLEDARGIDAGEPGPAVIKMPPRFVSLAVMARREGRLSLAEMAGYLDVDEATARLVESSFSRDPEGDADGDSAD